MHCLRCGTRLVTAEVDGRARLTCPACAWVHWDNPVPAVGAVIRRDEQALLARRARPPKEGLWDLPGGFMEADERPEDAVRREVEEETGMQARVGALLGALPGRYGDRPTLNLMYAVEADGEPDARDDVAELRWWPLDGLPELAWEHEGEVLRGLSLH